MQSETITFGPVALGQEADGRYVQAGKAVLTGGLPHWARVARERRGRPA
ncbi:hypothetical protein [Nonomuraea sp. NPDC049784]